MKNDSSELLLLQKKDSVLHELYKKADSLYTAKNYTIALQFAFKIVDEADSEEDLELVSKSNFLIGKIWYKNKDFDKAILYFKSSMDGLRELLEKRNFPNELGPNNIESNYKLLDNKLRIGTSYQELFEIARNYDSLPEVVLRNKDSALFYYKDIVNNSNVLDKQHLLLKSRAYHNLAGIYTRDSIYDIAEEYTMKSIEIRNQYGDVYTRAIGYNSLFNVYFAKQDYKKAQSTLEEGLKVIEKSTGKRIDQLRAGMNLNIAYSLYLMKDYKAYEYQEKSWELYDKLKDAETEQAIANINAERNFNKGLNEGIFREEIKRQKAQKWYIGGGVAFLAVIVILVFLLKQYKLRQKNLGLELSRQELIQQQKLEKIKTESQIRILNATLDGKESERKQIAETLHDSVSALLSSANLHLQACKTQFNGSTPIEVDKSQNIINEASQKIRDLSHTLVSSILLKFGLSFAIKDIAEKFSNSELTIDYETKYIQRYDQGFEIKLYNIIQEFVNNILKHSKASYAKITLIEKRKKLYLTIEDNGQGFDKNIIPEKDGLGINQIDARIQMMQGKFEIDSAHGQGTKISIELPVFEKQLETIS